MTETNAERLERLENEWRIKSANYDWMLEQARLADDYLAIVDSQRDSITRLTSENGRLREAHKGVINSSREGSFPHAISTQALEDSP